MAKAESSRAATQLKAQPNTIANYELPWVEKYRPIVLDDIVGNTETIERLKIIAKDGNMPHVIISGMPGIGKTTSVLCLARQLLGDAYKEAVLELNASDERGTIHCCRYCDPHPLTTAQASMLCGTASKPLHRRR